MTDSWYSISFGRTYQTPRFVAALGYNDPDNAQLRYRNLTTTGVQVRAEEDTTYDPEMNHPDWPGSVAEAVHYLVFADSGQLSAWPYSAPSKLGASYGVQVPIG